jgi:hypothetical protein
MKRTKNKSLFASFSSEKEDPPRSGKAQSSFFEKKAAKKLSFLCLYVESRGSKRLAKTRLF